MRRYDPTDVHSLARAKADIDLRDKLQRETEEADFTWLMHTRRGRRIVDGIIRRSRAGDCVFSTNALTMAFTSGMQVEGEYNERMAKRLCPDSYLLMLKERNDEQRNDAGG